MKINITIAASELLKMQPSKKIVKKPLGAMLKIAEKYFGSSMLLKIPSSLQAVDPNLLPEVEIASRLKSIGIVKNIKKISKEPDEPFLFCYTTLPTVDASGSDFFSEKRAIWKMLGETIERALWKNSSTFYNKKIVKNSFNQIKTKSIDIFSLAGFSDEQRKNNKPLALDKNTIFGWLKVKSLISNKKILCPVQLLSARYWYENTKTPECETKPEPMLRWSVSTGLATGQSLEEAVLKGILEIIERDAFMITYLNKLSPPEIDLENLAEQDEEISTVLRSFKRYNLECHLLLLPTDFQVPVIFSLLVDKSGFGPALTVGACADFDTKSAILDALTESFAVRIGLKKKFRQKINLNRIHRGERLIYWADPAKSTKIAFLLKGKKTVLPALDKKRLFLKDYHGKERRAYYKNELANLTRQFKSKNYELVYADVTTPKIRSLGLRSVYVLSPDLQPMHLDESIPYLGGQRLKKIPLDLGYKSAVELNQDPHPFP